MCFPFPLFLSWQPLWFRPTSTKVLRVAGIRVDKGTESLIGRQEIVATGFGITAEDRANDILRMKLKKMSRCMRAR